MLEQLDRYHGQATGIFTCDEHLAGRSPSQGTELCTVVEAMYSLELAFAVTGDSRLGDRLEKLAFNALPATFKKDMTAHQYDQQANQVLCTKSGEHVYVNNGPDSNLFGLEPNFGCCTANFHQGWPKLVASLWMASAEGGLAKTIYGPCEVATSVGGVPVKLREETEYPFRDQVTIHVSGAFFFGSAPMVEQVLERIGAQPKELVFDLSDVTFMDSSAAQLMVQAIARAAKVSQTVVVRGAKPAVLKALKASGYSSG
jgi:anti-anti-sigma factor